MATESTSDFEATSRKIVSILALNNHLEQWRRQGLQIGFTNGCFDLLHPGHIKILEEARQACDRLIVGLNSDASVSRLKGADRPIVPEYGRARLLAALAAVDVVIIFHDDTPSELIHQIRPAVLVKGGDYVDKPIVGSDTVIADGGKVLLIDLEAGFSSTLLIDRLRST